MRYTYLFVLLVCFIPSLYSIQTKDNDKVPSDTLSGKNFNELRRLFWEKKQDSTIKYNVAETFLLKAKELNDSAKMSQAYYLFSIINNKQLTLSLKYADSMIDAVRGISHKYLSSAGYMRKGNVLYDLGRYTDALEAYLIAKEKSELNNNQKNLFGLKHNIALLKTVLGKDIEALEVYRDNYSYLLQNDPSKEKYKEYIETLYQIAESFNHLKNYDSAYYYIDKSVRLSLETKEKYEYENLLVISGVNNYYREEYSSSMDSLKKALVLFKNDVNHLSVKISYLYLAKTLIKEKQESEGVVYLKKIDSFTNASNYVFQIRDAYTLLIDYYKRNNDQQSQLKIMDKLIGYNAALSEKHSVLNKELVVKYDTIELVKDKELLVKKIQSKSRTLLYRLLLLLGLIIVLICFFFFYVQKKRKDEYNVVLSKQLKYEEKLKEDKIKSTISSLDLSVDLIKEILDKLKDFETNQGYLKNDLTLVKISKNLKTNSTYLSKVINIEKKKNFTNYINDLRIDFCVDQIKNNKQFKQYSIRSMATEVGFNNIQSFAKAFSKINGCNPAEFIKKLS